LRTRKAKASKQVPILENILWLLKEEDKLSYLLIKTKKRTRCLCRRPVVLSNERLTVPHLLAGIYGLTPETLSSLTRLYLGGTTCNTCQLFNQGKSVKSPAGLVSLKPQFVVVSARGYLAAPLLSEALQLHCKHGLAFKTGNISKRAIEIISNEAATPESWKSVPIIVSISIVT